MKAAVMKKFLIFAAGLAMLSTAAMAQQNNQSQNYIAVNGYAEREVTPNEIYISITIDESSSRNSKTTVAEQERRMVDALEKIGIDTETLLQVGDMSGDLTNYILRRDRVQTSKNYVLKVSDAATMASVFQTLGDLGVSSISLMKATRNDVEQIQLELRAEAIRNAKDIADTLAEAIGQKAGKALMITDNSYYGNGTIYFSNPVMMTRAMDTAVEETASSKLDFQDIKISCSVNVRFALE